LQPHALLCLANNTCVKKTFESQRDRFQKLYRKKAYVHHFTSEGLEASRFDEAIGSLSDLIRMYDDLEASPEHEEPPPRMEVL